MTSNVSKIPVIGWNVTKLAKSVRVCGNVCCDLPVVVESVDEDTGQPQYRCPKHGKRNRRQMHWLEFVTTATFQEKVGF